MSAFRDQTKSFETVGRLHLLIAIFFGTLCFVFLGNSHDFARNPRVEYLWPMFWGPWFDRNQTISILLLFGFFSFFLGLLFPNKRLPKLLMGYSFLCQLNIAYTFGNVGHANHGVLWALLLLALCPSYTVNASRALKQRVLFNFFLIQVFVGLFYFLAGFTKFFGALNQLFLGEWSAFHPSGMSRILSERLILGNTSTIWGNFFVENYWIGFFAFWISITFEMLSLAVVFFPRWHRVWAIGMIFFHVMVALTLSPTFTNNLWLLGLLFLASPFSGTKNPNWWRPTRKWIFGDLPKASSKGTAPVTSQR